MIAEVEGLPDANRDFRLCRNGEIKLYLAVSDGEKVAFGGIALTLNLYSPDAAAGEKCSWLDGERHKGRHSAELEISVIALLADVTSVCYNLIGKSEFTGGKHES